MHLDLDDAVALAGLAAAALDVEREAPGLVAARLRFRQAGEPFADRREGAGIGRGVGARGAADRRLVDVDDLVDVLEALDAVVRRGALAGIVQLARDRLVERVDQQGRLAAAGDAGDAGEQAERNLGRDVLQIVAAGVDHLDGAAMVRRPPVGHRHRKLTGEVLAGQRFRVAHDLVGRAFRDDVAAMHAGAGADIEHVIRQANGVLVMLDHDHGVAEVAQPLQGIEQPGIVALVQADRRLVQHVEHAGQSRADLRGEADALALAAGQRTGGARQRQVVQADVEQEGQALADLLEDARRDLVLLRVQRLRHRLEPFAGALDRELGDLADMLAADLDAQRLRLQAIAVAAFAGHVGEILAELLARPLALGLAVAAVDVGDDALERFLGVVGAHAVLIGELDLVVAGAVQQRGLHLLRQILPLGVERELVVLAERGQGLDVIGRGRFCPWRDRALAQGQLLVRDDQVLVDMLLDAEAAAGRTGAVGIVEREQARLDLGDREAGHRAGELFGEQDALGAALVVDFCGLLLVFLLAGSRRRRVGVFDHREAIGELQRGLETFSEALGQVGAHHDAVDHHVDVVREFLVEARGLRQLMEGAVDLDALKALLEVFGELLLVLALAAAHDRRQQIEAGAFGQRQHAVDHLRDDLALDRQSRRRRIGHADPRPQQAHVVVDLGDGADGGARVLRGRLLLDRDRRRQAVDLVDIRLLHHLQKLPRIGRQRLDVAALALGIDGVERERRLAGAGQAGEHHELVARNLDVDVLQIVFARAADRDGAR